mgnify:CR=1 FL=1
MSVSARRQWQHFKALPSGRRFETRYRLRRARSGGIAGYVFGGVMAGISFFLLNNVFGYAGSLQNWSPLWSAAAPGLTYSVLSLAAFGWLVLRR